MPQRLGRDRFTPRSPIAGRPVIAAAAGGVCGPGRPSCLGHHVERERPRGRCREGSSASRISRACSRDAGGPVKARQVFAYLADSARPGACDGGGCASARSSEASHGLHRMLSCEMSKSFLTPTRDRVLISSVICRRWRRLCGRWPLWGTPPAGHVVVGVDDDRTCSACRSARGLGGACTRHRGQHRDACRSRSPCNNAGAVNVLVAEALRWKGPFAIKSEGEKGFYKRVGSLISASARPRSTSCAGDRGQVVRCDATRRHKP